MLEGPGPGTLGDARCLPAATVLINIRDRQVWIFQPAVTAKEIWTVLQGPFRPAANLNAKETAGQSAKLLEGGDIRTHVRCMGRQKITRPETRAPSSS